MPSIVIADTSCLIVLEKINQLYLLSELYNETLTTPEILSEYDRLLPEWIQIRTAKNKNLQIELQKDLDIGEASAIAPGLETDDCVVVLDDLKARKTAQSLSLNFTGSLGILVKAKERGLILSIKPLLNQLRKVGLRFSKEVENDILTQANE